MADDPNVEVRFGANTDGIKRGAKETEDQIRSLKESVEGISATFRHFGEIIGLSFTVEGIKEFVTSMAELGEQTLRTSEIFGITTEEVGQLRFEAEATGGSGDALVRSLERMSVALQQAGTHSTPTSAALKALGINAKELSGMSLPNMLDAIRDKFSKLPEGMERTAIAAALVRGGAETLLPILRLNNDEVAKMQKDFKATGAQMDGETARAFAATEGRIVTMKESFVGLGMRIFEVFRPAIDSALEGITKIVQGIDAEKIESAAMTIVDWATTIILTVGHLAIEIGRIIDDLVAKLSAYGTVFKRAAEGAGIGAAMGVAGGGVGALPAGVLGAGVGATVGIIENYFTGVNGATEKGVLDTEALTKRFDAAVAEYSKSIKTHLVATTFKDRFADAFGGTTKPDKSGPRGPALDFGPAPKDAFQTAVDDTIKQTAAINAQAKALGMGAAKAIAYTEAQKLLAIAEVTGHKVTDADRISIDQKTQALAKATIELQHYKEIQDSMRDLAQGITDAFMSWVDGTDTLGNAFLKLAAQMAEAVVQALILDLILSALGLAMPTTGLGAVFGPIFGGGKEQGGPLEQGKWYIAGEKGPEPIWGGGPGAYAAGYPQQEQHPVQITYAPTVHAMDSAGVDRVLQQHGATFAKHVASQFNKNPSTRPKY